MEIYAGFIQAQRRELIETIPFYTTNARSKEEADGIGMKLAREHFPPSDGWAGHASLAMRIDGTFGKIEPIEEQDGG